MERVRVGDRESFSLLYRQYLGPLYRYVFLFTGSKESTEDILQGIFLRIWENRTSLVGIGSFKGYLFRSARNRLIDHLRRLQTRRQLFREIMHQKDTVQEDLSDEVDYREYHRLVQEAIEKLPPKRKMIFRLNVEQGLTQEQIARELSISKSVVQKQIYMASDFVRKYLSRYGELSLPLSSVLLSLGIMQ